MDGAYAGTWMGAWELKENVMYFQRFFEEVKRVTHSVDSLLIVFFRIPSKAVEPDIETCPLSIQTLCCSI